MDATMEHNVVGVPVEEIPPIRRRRSPFLERVLELTKSAPVGQIVAYPNSLKGNRTVTRLEAYAHQDKVALEAQVRNGRLYVKRTA